MCVNFVFGDAILVLSNSISMLPLITSFDILLTMHTNFRGLADKDFVGWKWNGMILKCMHGWRSKGRL